MGSRFRECSGKARQKPQATEVTKVNKPVARLLAELCISNPEHQPLFAGYNLANSSGAHSFCDALSSPVDKYCDIFDNYLRDRYDSVECLCLTEGFSGYSDLNVGNDGVRIKGYRFYIQISLFGYLVTM